MLDSIYVGLTGLIGYSNDLSVIGNNAANLNTPGYKSQQLLFTDSFYRASQELGNGDSARFDQGSGLEASVTRRNFKAGDLRQTGGEQDVAIDGNGFFVVRREGRTLYTRAGQFSFDEDGFLVSRSQSSRVAGLSGGALVDISLSGLRTAAGRPTSRISFAGILNTNDAATSPHTVANVPVFDAAGGSHTLTMRFTNNSSVTPQSWRVEAQENGTTVGSGEIRFNGNGTPAAGFNSVSFTYTPAGVAGSLVELFFGTPNSNTGATSLSSASSTLALGSQDGFAPGSLTASTFDENGVLTLSYSNGQTAKGSQLALASFAFVQGLEPQQGNLFAARDDLDRTLGVAGQGVFGVIRPGQIEISNVDLSQEFSNLIISQRGYQASSQVISTSNELIQQLFDIKQRR